MLAYFVVRVRTTKMVASVCVEREEQDATVTASYDGRLVVGVHVPIAYDLVNTPEKAEAWFSDVLACAPTRKDALENACRRHSGIVEVIQAPAVVEERV